MLLLVEVLVEPLMVSEAQDIHLPTTHKHLLDTYIALICMVLTVVEAMVVAVPTMETP